MSTTRSTESQDAVYKIRQLLAQKESLVAAKKRGHSPTRMLRVALSIACFSVVFTGLSVFLLSSSQSNAEPLVGLTRSDGMDSGFARRNTVVATSGVEDLRELRTEIDFASDPPAAASSTVVVTEEPTPVDSQTFIVRVGSFRNPSNAERVVESLQGQSTDVSFSLLPGGLHEVALGPFVEQSAAEDAARSVEEAMGLRPQVLRRTHR